MGVDVRGEEKGRGGNGSRREGSGVEGSRGEGGS